jgi:hypothetical protein
MLNRTSNRGLIGLAIVGVFFTGCRIPGQDTDFREPDRQRSAETLAGEWRWVQSARDGQVMRRAGTADRITVRIGAWGEYWEHMNGRLLSGHYKYAQGRLQRLQDSAFVVLVLDSSRFFPSGEGRQPMVAIRSFKADSMFLSGTGEDATLHTFVKVPWTPSP